MAYQKSDDDDELDGASAKEHEELTEEDIALLGGKPAHTASSGGYDDDDDEDGGETTSTQAFSMQDDDLGEEVLVTKEGFKKLQDELHTLETVRRKEIAVRLKEAIAFGDLSENSEYQDAKAEQAFMEGRIVELRDMIKRAKIITEKHGKTIRIGSTVTVQNLTDKDEAEVFTIVGSTEASPMEKKISNESPLGAALLDQTEGDEVKFFAPAGAFRYKVLKVQ